VLGDDAAPGRARPLCIERLEQRPKVGFGLVDRESRR
jgi:hypothetical protein